MAFVTVERKGGCAVITYANRPFGTMTAAGSREMYAAVKAASDDPAVRSIILTGGVPGIFVRHYDVGELSVMSDRIGEAAPPSTPPPPPEPGFLEMTDLLAAAPKPVIAAINGLCMGGGFEMSLACDLRICGDEVASIGLPETRVGIFPGGGGTQRLPRMLGEAKALEFILKGTVVTAAEAHNLGLVHELAGDPLERALELASEFAARPPAGLAYAKRLTRAALDRPLSEGLADERRSFLEVCQVPSTQAALAAAARPNVEIQKV